MEMKAKNVKVGNLKTEPSKDPDSHYATRIQPIEFMQANFTPEEFLGYLKCTVIKYAARMSRKGQSESDARKLKRYSGWVKQAEAGQIIDPRKED